MLLKQAMFDAALQLNGPKLTCVLCELRCCYTLCDGFGGDLHPKAAFVWGLVQPGTLHTVSPVLTGAAEADTH